MITLVLSIMFFTLFVLTDCPVIWAVFPASLILVAEIMNRITKHAIKTYDVPVNVIFIVYSTLCLSILAILTYSYDAMIYLSDVAFLYEFFNEQHVLHVHPDQYITGIMLIVVFTYMVLLYLLIKQDTSSKRK